MAVSIKSKREIELMRESCRLLAIVHKAMEDLLYVPFEFENSGTRVIHYTPEVYEKRQK